MKKISVVITAYNSAAFIAEAIESALRQTHAPAEIVVVDDGSTDNTAGIVSTYAPRIRYIKKANGGPSSARNLGIESTTGEYVAFLDADDVWMPEKLREQAALLQSADPVGMVTCGRRYMDQQGVVAETIVPSLNALSRKSLIEELSIANIVGGASAVLIRRSVFQDCGMFDNDLHVSEDTDMWIRIAAKHDIKCVEKPLYLYRCVENSQSSNAHKSISNQFQVTDRLLSRGIISKSVWHKALSYKYSCAARSSLQNDNRRDALIYIMKSFRHAPPYFMRDGHMLLLMIRIIIGDTLFGTASRLLKLFAARQPCR